MRAAVSELADGVSFNGAVEDGADVSAAPRRRGSRIRTKAPGGGEGRSGMDQQEEKPSPGSGGQAGPAPVPFPDLYTSSSRNQGPKLEKDQLAPTFPLGDCSSPCLSGSGRTNVVPSTSSSRHTQDLRLQKRRPLPGKQYPCSSYGCKLVCSSSQELAHHLRSHYLPTQSMGGKLFHCSTLGCADTFPSMQELVTHMKVHYKPNRYFKCENCLLRFRTHRSLFKHLHVCSDPSRSPTAGPPPPALEKEPPEPEPSAGPSPEAAPLLSPLPLGPSHTQPFPLLEPSLFDPASLPRFPAQASSPMPGAFLPYLPPSPYSLPPGSGQQRLRPFLPAQALPISNAIWKKSQGVSGSPRRPPGGSEVLAGHSSNSRIVWEHTRGRYTCMQCPFSTASRPAMTLHLEDHRKTPPPPARLDAHMDFGVGLAAFPSKLPAEMESSLYSQL
ncbi:zinc finger protein 414 [Tachyglossus aculeatus]|uniref:zinc finger protein 414 n=1 Tax=Tachyglossus aculeatus TaxID=9261 RepID=UPI0018F30025|nr:zinc finger protein 414 [Tachyglossus aculeatus]